MEDLIPNKAINYTENRFNNIDDKHNLNHLFDYSKNKKPINIKFEDKIIDSDLYDLTIFFALKDLNNQIILCDKLKDNEDVLELIKTRKFEANYLNAIILTIKHDDKYQNIAIIGLGEAQEFSEIDAFQIGSKIQCVTKTSKAKNLLIYFNDKINDAKIVNNIIFGINYSNYNFDKYLSKSTKNTSCSIDSKRNLLITLVLDNKKEAEDIFSSETEHTIFASNIARDLGNFPPNALYPSSYAEYIKQLFAEVKNVEVEILDEEKLALLNMKCLLGVGQGSQKASRVVIVKYKGDLNSDNYKISLVGKGVCFDTGGISIKPSGNMDQMKYDMCGSAAVTAATYAIAASSMPINIALVVGLVENMPSGNAQRPGDIVYSMSGKSVEILNTDAEGRLVLIDLFEYVSQYIKSEYMINLATLTGAIGVALGSAYAGLFSNNETFAAKLANLGKNTGEKLWHMPGDKHYRDQMKSTHADIANIATQSPGHAGSCTAYAFLNEFVSSKVKHAHIDIATVASNCNYLKSYTKGATGFGVKFLINICQDLLK